MTFQEWLTANAWPEAATLPEGQRNILMAAWRAAVAPPNPQVQPPPNPNPAPNPSPAPSSSPAPTNQPAGTIDQIEAAARNERERQNRINAAIAEELQGGATDDHIALMGNLGREAIRDNWNIERFELELLRKRRPNPPSGGHSRQNYEGNDAVIEAAVCRAGGLNTSEIESYFDERTLEASDRVYRNGLSLNDLIMTFARRAGYNGISVKADIAGAMRAAFSVKAAGTWGPSTGSTGLAGILSNTANKFLRAGFDSVDTTWRRITATRNVNNFQTITTYALTGGMTVEKVLPGGEIKHGQLGAETYNNKVDTYGKMLGIDRQDMINDDLGALTRLSRKMGRGYALGLNARFWTVFLNNSSFFTSGRNNVSTGAGSALSDDGLKAAMEKFMSQTDPDGDPLGLTPAILLVPTALWKTAKNLVESGGLNQTPASNTAAGDKNVWQGMFRVESSPYMHNTNYAGYSTAAWYLLANPEDSAVIETAFLNGREEPFVETADADFSQLGISMRVYGDFGIALQEYRAGVRSAGS